MLIGGEREQDHRDRTEQDQVGRELCHAVEHDRSEPAGADQRAQGGEPDALHRGDAQAADQDRRADRQPHARQDLAPRQAHGLGRVDGGGIRCLQAGLQGAPERQQQIGGDADDRRPGAARAHEMGGEPGRAGEQAGGERDERPEQRDRRHDLHAVHEKRDEAARAPPGIERHRRGDREHDGPGAQSEMLHDRRLDDVAARAVLHGERHSVERAGVADHRHRQQQSRDDRPADPGRTGVAGTDRRRRADGEQCDPGAGREACAKSRRPVAYQVGGRGSEGDGQKQAGRGEEHDARDRPGPSPHRAADSAEADQHLDR